MNEQTPPALNLKLLGTGAADYDWNRFGEEGVRGSTSSLLDGHILIDCGITGLRNLERFGIPCAAIDTLLITHSHDDHFLPEWSGNAAMPGMPPSSATASAEA